MRSQLSLSLIVLSIPAITLSAQRQIVSMGVGRNFENDSMAYSFSGAFNPKPTAGKTRPIALMSWGNGTQDYYLTPYAEANLGSGTTAAANNIIAGITVTPWFALGNAHFLTGGLGPSLTTDKDFLTTLYYVTASLEYRALLGRGKVGVTGALGIGVDAGMRSSAGADSHRYLRGWPYATLNFGRGQLLTLDLAAMMNSLADNDAVVKDGTYMRIVSTLKIRLPGDNWSHLGFNVKYEHGREQPLYKNVHTLFLGATLFQ